MWDTAHSREAVADGTYTFKVGTDATNIAASKDVQVTGSRTSRVQYVTVQPPAVDYQAGQSLDLTGTNTWIADDTNPAEETDRNMSITANGIVEAIDNDESFVNLANANELLREAVRWHDRENAN